MAKYEGYTVNVDKNSEGYIVVTHGLVHDQVSTGFKNHADARQWARGLGRELGFYVHDHITGRVF